MFNGLQDDRWIGAGLPSGQSWLAKVRAHKTAWALWRKLAAEAIPQGMGVAAIPAGWGDGGVIIATVAPSQGNNYQRRYHVSGDGHVTDLVRG
jgi:hypothetical protein